MKNFSLLKKSKPSPKPAGTPVETFSKKTKPEKPTKVRKPALLFGARCRTLRERFGKRPAWETGIEGREQKTANAQRPTPNARFGKRAAQARQSEEAQRRQGLINELLGRENTYSTEEEIFEAIERGLRVAVLVSGATAGYVMLVNHSDHSLVNEVAICLGERRGVPLTRGFGEGIEGRTAIAKTPILLSNAMASPHSKSRRGQSPPQSDLPEGAQCGLCLPILPGDHAHSPYALLGVLTLLNHDRDKAFSDEHAALVSTVCEMIGSALAAMIHLLDNQEKMMLELYEIVLNMENKDNSTRGHSQRVAEICLRIGQRFGLDTDTLRILRTGALLHEIGKIRIDDEILHKPGRLTDSEFGILRMYPIYGYELCQPLGLPAETLLLVRNHAERLDGSGYPDRLKMGDLPLPLRILSVADAFDAMSSHRSYRAGMGFRERNEQLNRFAGTQFDPTVVETLKHLANNGELDELYYSATALEQMHAA